MAAPATHAATEGRGVGGVRGQPVERLLRVECPPEHLFRIQGRLVRLRHHVRSTYDMIPTDYQRK